MTSTHTIPEILDGWLSGWLVSKRGNPYLRLGDDVYSVFPSRRGGWTASVGRTFVNVSWPDVESAKCGLYDIVREAGPERLAAMHAGEDWLSTDRREPAPEPGRGQDPEPQTLLSLPRERTEGRLERREYEGRGFLALVVYSFGPKGPRQDKVVSIRYSEAGRIAEAIRESCSPGGDDREEGPRFVDRRRPQRPPWNGAALPAPADSQGGQGFDEFAGY
jgi:hypothetical protein